MTDLIKSKLAELVVGFSANMPLLADENFDGTEGTWYISPFQHAIETPFNLILSLYLIWSGLKAVLKEDSEFRLQSKAYQNRTKPRTMLEYVLIAVSLTSYAFMTYHKYQRNQLSYLIQFCHFNLITLIIILLTSTKHFANHLAFNTYMYYFYGTISALVFPDIRGSKLFFELENYYIEHYVLIIIPLLMLTLNNHSIWSINSHLLKFALGIKILLINVISTVVGLKLGVNVNYSLSPPPGILELFGNYYKFGFIPFAGALMLGSRFTVELIMLLKAGLVNNLSKFNANSSGKLYKSKKLN